MLAKNVDDVWGQLDQRVGKGGRLAAFLGPLDVGAQGAATGRDDASGTEQGHDADCDSRPNLQCADQKHSPTTNDDQGRASWHRRANRTSLFVYLTEKQSPCVAGPQQVRTGANDLIMAEIK